MRCQIGATTSTRRWTSPSQNIILKLRRDPDDSGYQFWLNKLNQFGGNFEQAEMVKAFIISGEYRDRFPR
ncbi:MAG TPA: hypothetical protein DHU55_18700 [Blastocatellia bacterium]|jgi:hypothetical protein|nr:hypothetical protein [Blastocatellia bacterium]HCX31775.1 hypothetical protein [Blastocatellia bacterium]